MLKRVNFLRVRCQYCKIIWVILRVRAYCSPIFGFRKLSRRQLSPQTWYDPMITCLRNFVWVFVSRINPLLHFGPASEEIPGAARKIGTPFVNPENCGYLSWQFQGIVVLGCTSKSPWSMNIEESTIQSNAVAHSLVDLLLLCPYSKGYRTFPFELSLLRYQRVLWQHPLWQSTFQNLSSAGCHFCHCVVLFWARSWSPGHVRFYLISITNGRNNWWTDAVERVWATR